MYLSVYYVDDTEKIKIIKGNSLLNVKRSIVIFEAI